MLPFGGQGSNCAIEDGGALGYLFQGVEDTKAIPERLRMFQQARQARAARVQILSSVRAGKEKEVGDQLLQYADPAGTGESATKPILNTNWLGTDCALGVPTSMMERTAHDYG